MQWTDLKTTGNIKTQTIIRQTRKQITTNSPITRNRQIINDKIEDK